MPLRGLNTVLVYSLWKFHYGYHFIYFIIYFILVASLRLALPFIALT